MRKLSAWLLGCALATALLPSTGAAKGVSITALGGTIIPTGNFGDKNVIGADVGYQVGGSIDYDLNDAFTVGVDGSFNKGKGAIQGETIPVGTGGDFERVDKADFSTLQGAVHGKYWLPVKAPFRPYLLLGLGLYRTKYTADGVDVLSGVSTSFTEDIRTGKQFGGKIGVGGAWSINPMWAVGAELNYNYINGSNDNFQSFKRFFVDDLKDIKNLQYLGITAGLTWKVPTMSK